MERKVRWIRFVLMIVLYQCTHMVTSILPEELQFPLLQKVIPERYEVTIEHNIDDPVPNYSGEVRIEVQCVTTTEIISFNQAGSVEVNDVEVKLLSEGDDNHFTIKESKYSRGNQTELTLNKPLEAKNKYEIKIKFSNIFAFAGLGYTFKTYEKDGFTNPKVMTFTKLNEFDARRVIPCFDQINLKAKFKMWLVHPERLKGFSNAELKSRKKISDKPGWVIDEFHETENMATFSIAIALLEFETTGLLSSSNVKVQTLADGVVIRRMSYINELAFESLKFFSKLFKKPHPLKKLDIFILPNVDFEVEQSFGMIFMSEKYVLETLEKSAIPTTYAMVSKICYAVSYQWIGCSVTMSKWQDNWFHQGLNYFLQEECAKKIFPDYSKSVSELNTIESFIAFMRSEEIGEYDKPITILKSYPNLDFMKFVTIEKVHHLIRMINFITGPKLFKKSLVMYTEDFNGLNSELNDALDVFTKRANSVTPKILPYHRFTIESIIKSWLHRTEVPLIIARRDDESKEIILRQEIFNSLELDVNYRAYSNERYWLIPLSCTTEKELKFDEVTPRVWLADDQLRWRPPGGFEGDHWILCNLEFNVPGRVLYDGKTWNLIHKFFVDPDNKFKQINVLTRARVISDMFTLAEAGELTYEIVLSTMKYLHDEEDLVPWSIALKEFDLIRSRLLGSGLALLERYVKFVRGILEPVFQKPIVKNFSTHSTENTLEGQFQILFMEISCKFDSEGCTEKSSELKKIWDRTSTQRKELEIRRRLYKVVLCEQIKHGNKEKWSSFWKSYYEEERQSSKEDLLQAFVCSQKTENLQRLLEQSISDPNISRKDSIIIFQSLSSQKKGYKLMKNFFMNSYDKINSFHSEGEPSKLSYLRILFDVTNRRRDLNKITQFAISKHVDMSDKLTNKSIENARRNITWVHTNKNELKKFLSDFTLKNLFDKLKNKFKFK